MIQNIKNVKFLSDKYKVTAIGKTKERADVCVALLADGTTNNIKLPPEIYAEYDGLGMGTKTIKTYYANVEFERGATVEVDMPNDTEKLTVKPNRYKDCIKFEDGKAIITTEDSMNFYLEPNDDIFGGIHIFCNKQKKIAADKSNFIEFTDGIYTAENCEYIRINESGTPIIDCIKDNTVVHISNNATVNAAIVLNGVKNVRICGNGEVSLVDRCHGADECFKNDRYWGAFRENALPNIYIKGGCENIEVDDILLNCEFRGIAIRNSKNIKINNVKMFTSTENADGINCVNTTDLLVDGCYIQSADDCFCMYDSCDSIPWLGDKEYKDPSGVCDRAEVKNCIMASNARPFVLGGHATGAKSPRCKMRDIYIHNCEITDTPYRIFGNTKEYAMYWSGLMRILSQSEQLVQNITFEDMIFNVTKGHNGKAVHIEVRDKSAASYTEVQGYRIENITFKNIIIKGSTGDMADSLIKCGVDGSADCGIENIKFENVKISDREMTRDDVLKIGNVSKVEFLREGESQDD